MGIWHRYAVIVLGGAALASILHVVSFLGFVGDPQSFYYRAWEWFDDFPYRSRSFAGVWDRVEEGDRANRFVLLYEQERKTRVTTDADGFRSVPQSAARYRVLVGGDSTVWGSGLSDAETLPALLAEALGEPVFNASRTNLDNALLHGPLTRVEVVVDGRSERRIRGAVFEDYGDSVETYQPLVRDDLGEWQTYLAVNPQRYSPVARIPTYLQRLRRDFQALARGEADAPYVFLTHRFDPVDLAEAVNSIAARQRRLAARGIRYLFVPIPAKQTLYKADVDPFTRNYLVALHGALDEHGIESVDLITAFQTHKDNGLFQPYDTHWNAKGTRLASRLIAAQLRR